MSATDVFPAARGPAAIAARLETAAVLPNGRDERLVGYGVMGAPFSSGDLLAMRRFPVSSFGSGYTTVWHRDVAGDWTIYSDRPPLEACPRYFGSALTRAIKTPIALSWTGARKMQISVPAARLAWSIELKSTVATRLMNAIGRLMPDRMWRSPGVLAVLAWVASTCLRAGRLGLSGRVPNGQAFVANPTMVWAISASRATIGGRDLGRLEPLPQQVRLGDFWIPQRGLFAFGRVFFEPLDCARHKIQTSLDARPARSGTGG